MLRVSPSLVYLSFSMKFYMNFGATPNLMHLNFLDSVAITKWRQDILEVKATLGRIMGPDVVYDNSSSKIMHLLSEQLLCRI
jgi:hypothetical protein